MNIRLPSFNPASPREIGREVLDAIKRNASEVDVPGYQPRAPEFRGPIAPPPTQQGAPQPSPFVDCPPELFDAAWYFWERVFIASATTMEVAGARDEADSATRIWLTVRVAAVGLGGYRENAR